MDSKVAVWARDTLVENNARRVIAAAAASYASCLLAAADKGALGAHHYCFPAHYKRSIKEWLDTNYPKSGTKQVDPYRGQIEKSRRKAHGFLCVRTHEELVTTDCRASVEVPVDLGGRVT
ncbi:hypothetical protein EVAR_52828_1 [Eumeta japonica]|uniref:Uncharacterized protein n=1 Tax=Eumeta variegata TaxID=151549 RepID=A0A4C1YEM5_EUMVA|nr:hypothetical protein EVAR_52828_1 [Eumeta japonica]